MDKKKVRFIIQESCDSSDSAGLLAQLDVVLLCFNIMDPSSLYSAVKSWVPACQDTPLLLVGCQADLRTDKLSLSGLARRGKVPVSSNMALAFSRQVEAVMYVETETVNSSRSSAAAFDLAVKTCLGQFCRQSSVMSSSSSITSPLLPGRTSRSASRVRTDQSSSNPGQLDFWNRFRSPSCSRAGRSATKSPACSRRHGPPGGSVRSQSSVRSEASTISIQTGRAAQLTKTPRMSRRFSGHELSEEKMVKIKCLRLNEDKTKEEIEIEVPAAVYDNLESGEASQEKLEEKGGEEGSWSNRLKCLFAKS